MGLIVQGPQANPTYQYGYVAFDSVTSDPLADTVNNLDIAGMFFASQLNLQASAAFTLTGLAQGRPGKTVTLCNRSAFVGSIVGNSSGSDANNRFASDASIAAGSTLQVIYDGDLSLWLPQSAGAGSGGGGSPILLNNVVTPPALAAGNTADLDITGLATCNMLRMTANVAGSTVLGIIAVSTSIYIPGFNIGVGDLTFANEAGGEATATNRLLTPGAMDYTVPTQASFTLWRDTTSSRWRIGS